MTGTVYIRAVLITDGKSTRLPATLAALAELSLTPDSLHIVILGDVDRPTIPDALRAYVTRSGARTYADAIDVVLGDHAAQPGEWLWLLHDDTAPAPDALAKLEATARKRPRAAVVGGAHVRWDDAKRLVNVGTTVSRWGGRRIGLVAEDDVDQGQHSAREDVLAVSLAAALVARDAWEALGGIDPGYRGFGASIDFCRRAWTSGRDVVVVPAARIRHSQDSLYARRQGLGLKRATHAERRTGEWYHAFAWAPWWAIPLLALLVVPSACVRAVTRVMQNHPRLVLAELYVPIMVVGRAGEIAQSRRAINKTARHRGVERRLLAGTRQVATHVRERELGGWEQWRAERAPSDVARAELAARRARNRVMFAVVALVGCGASAALMMRWAVDLVGGAMLTGPGVGATDVTTTELWARAWTGWSEAGLGAPALDGALAAMLLPATAMGGDARLGIGLGVCLAPLLAMVGAWFAAGAATRAVGVRAAVAIAYGLWPLFLASALDVRLTAVIAHVALPWVAWGVARGTGWRKGELLGDGTEFPPVRKPSASAGLLAAVALAVVTTAAPVVLAPALIALAVLGFYAGPVRWRVWTVGLLSLVIAAPGLVAAARHPADALAVLAREPGPSPTFEALTPLGLLTANDGSHRWADVFHAVTPVAYVPVTVVLLGAIAAAVFGRRSFAVVSALGIGALGLATAAGSQALVVAWPDAAGSPGVVGWPGAGSSLFAIGVLGAIALSYGMVPLHREGRVRVGAGLARASAAVAVAAFVAPAVFLAWPDSSRGVGHVGSPDVLPLAVPLELDGTDRQRALVLVGGDDGSIAYTVLATDGSEFVSGRAFYDDSGAPLVRPGAPDPGISRLGESVAQLAVTGAGGAEQLAAWGIGVIVIPPADDRLKAALDANPDVALVGGSERGTTYRVDRPLHEAPVSRAWIEAPEGVTVIPSTGSSGSIEMPDASGGLLIIAASADPAWSAYLDGESLYATRDELGRQAFAIPSGGGTLEFEYRDLGHRAWWWAAAAATAWALLGAIPLGARGLREPVAARPMAKEDAS